MGAMEFINNIKVQRKGKNQLEVTVTPKEFLGIAPILSSLDGEYEISEPKRGKKYDWSFNLRGVEHLVLEGSGIVKNERFRIEVLK